MNPVPESLFADLYARVRERNLILRDSFRKMAATNKCKAVAIVFDVAVQLPDSDRNGDAIQVCLDHIDGCSAEVFLPYEIVNKTICYGKLFAQEGERQIF